MFNFIKSLFQKKYFTGLIEDPRPESAKAEDYLHEEIAGASVPVYKTGMSNLNDCPDENQNQTSSCVAHGCTLADTGGSPRLSKMFVYRKRQNYPQEGMWLQNAGDILKNSGSCLYSTLPNVQTEAIANAMTLSSPQIEEASKNKIYKYVQIQTPNDIDKLASIISQGYKVAILIYASYKEWSKAYPSLEDNTTYDKAVVRHCICGIDAFIDNGTKFIKIKDSAPFGGISTRYLSEAFIKARCYGGIYFTKLEPGTVEKPDHVFNQDMRQGDKNDEVTFLQKRLMYEGTFPLTQTPTGLFGGITLKAVMDYQKAHGIPWTGFVGPMTRARLNAS